MKNFFSRFSGQDTQNNVKRPEKQFRKNVQMDVCVYVCMLRPRKIEASTKCVRKVSDLRLYLRARALERPLRGMSVNSSPSRTP